MNRRLFLQLSGPAAIVGALLLVGSMTSVWAIHRLQQYLSSILADNVSSLEAAQSLVIHLRLFRFHSVMNLLDPKPERQALLEEDHQGFEEALKKARFTATNAQERDLVSSIEAGYVRYRKELSESKLPDGKRLEDYVQWADQHPVRDLQLPCQQLLQLNKDQMEALAAESRVVSGQTLRAVLLIGILGPISGLIVGVSVSRAWSRSFALLRIRLQDMHAHLDSSVDELQLNLGEDWHGIERRLDQVLAKVKEASLQLQRNQHEIIRAGQLAVVGQLAASVAHEVRNPLTAIKMLIGAALRPSGRQALTQEDLEVVYHEVGKMEHTVQSLLDFSRVPKTQKERGDIRTVLDQAVDLVRPRIQQQNVAVHWKSTTSLAPVHMDPGALKNVFVNLLFNALDALNQGGVIKINAAVCERGSIQIRIEDNGPGISPELLPGLFHPFASNKPSGTGLGLSICDRIIREHGGMLKYEPVEPTGACFVVELPVATSENTDASITDRG